MNELDEIVADEPQIGVGVIPMFRCNTCGWIGTNKEMAADYTQEAWSNTVCPSCHTWDDVEPIGNNA